MIVREVDRRALFRRSVRRKARELSERPSTRSSTPYWITGRRDCGVRAAGFLRPRSRAVDSIAVEPPRTFAPMRADALQERSRTMSRPRECDAVLSPTHSLVRPGEPTLDLDAHLAHSLRESWTFEGGQREDLLRLRMPAVALATTAARERVVDGSGASTLTASGSDSSIRHIRFWTAIASSLHRHLLGSAGDRYSDCCRADGHGRPRPAFIQLGRWVESGVTVEESFDAARLLRLQSDPAGTLATRDMVYLPASTRT